MKVRVLSRLPKTNMKIKASQKREIILPDIKKFKSSDNKEIEIDIRESSACPRYAGCIIDNIKINESPSEIKDLLTSIGINPINNVGIEPTTEVRAPPG